MQARARNIASFLLASMTSLYFQYPAGAQYQHYGKSLYPKILSVVEDASGSFLLLNLQAKSCLQAPSIHYLPGPSGQTIMVADFADLCFNEEPKVLRPANSQINLIRIGQFQDSPPVFRISIATANPAALKNLEFRCQSKALVIKLPKETGKKSLPAADISPANAGQAKIPPAGNSSSQSLTEGAAPLSPSLPAAPPFSPGGLYLKLGQDPVLKSELPLKAAGTPASALPPVAPQLRSIRCREKMPAAAPPAAKTAENSQPSAVKPEAQPGLTACLKRIFRRHGPAENSLSKPEGEAEPTAAAAVSPPAQPDNNTNADGNKESTLSSANTEVEFSGSNPLKVRLKFEASVKYRSFRLDDPPRFVIDLENFQARLNPLSEPETNPWLKSVRVGAPEERVTRIVLDLWRPQVKVKEDLDATGQILTLTLGAEVSSPGALKGRQVVLDAGHGGSDPGAQRGDIQEKDITLAVASKVRTFLERKGVKVLMTRSDDSFVSLEDRTKLTNQAHPDAFISIHINSLESDRDIQGIETYYQTDQSRLLAQKVHARLLDGLQVPDRSIRKARFYVVNHTDRPAILAELGFISNKDERDKLISSDYQDKVAESLGQGVILYLGSSADPANAVVSAPQAAEAAAKTPSGKRCRSALASNEQSAVKQ
jgi:N-acetylmuramoyl-L-alanine amidase